MTVSNQILEFFSFENHAINVVIFGSILLGLTSAIIGVFSFLQKKSLLGDVVAHSLLPGVCIGFIVSGEKDTFTLLFFAILSGLFSVYFIDFIKSKSKIKNDSALAITLSIFFGFGLLLLSFIQNSENANQSGIDHFLFGKAASMMESDLIVYGIISIITLSLLFLFIRPFFVLSFDPNFGKVIGLPVNSFRLLLTTLTVIAVAIGIQTVGVVLMAAMLVTPAAGAKLWTNNLKQLMILAGGFGGFAGFFGAFISYVLPNMPTGPWIVVSLSMITLFSFLASPKKGLISNYIKRRKWQHQLVQENILKTIYHIGEKERNFKRQITVEEIIKRRHFDLNELHKHLKSLVSNKMILKSVNSYMLSSKGWERAKRLVKIHRLWEIYLTEKLNIAEDHVHEDADSIEHIITPDLEKELEHLLNYPKIDPHEKEIPY